MHCFLASALFIGLSPLVGPLALFLAAFTIVLDLDLAIYIIYKNDLYLHSTTIAHLSSTDGLVATVYYFSRSTIMVRCFLAFVLFSISII